MKPICIIILFFVFIFPTYLCAEDDLGLKYCQEIRTLAQNIMEKRQQGVPLEQLIEEFSKTDVYAAGYLAKLISEDAYSYSFFIGKEYAEKRIASFSQNYFISCVALDWHNKRNP